MLEYILEGLNKCTVTRMLHPTSVRGTEVGKNGTIGVGLMAESD